MIYMKKCLDKLEKMEPIRPPEEIEARAEFCEGIKLLLFDIYGTLLISGSGDIHGKNFPLATILKVLHESGLETDPEKGGEIASFIIREYKSGIQKNHETAKASGINYPEVNIVEIWKSIIDALYDAKLIMSREENPAPEKISFIFELLTNPVYPMPHMKELIVRLKKNNFLIGAISNAQFFTPVIMNYFLTGKISEGHSIEYFEEELTFFSYRHKIAKPDMKMFHMAREKLDSYGISPSQTLYVGNDMLNDIYPAMAAGFRTALFAQDARSLRLRKNLKLIENTRPDFVISKLSQIAEITGLKG